MTITEPAHLSPEDGDRAASTPDPLIGTVLPGKFLIKSHIATGSFGSVYRAHQLTVGRDVAVKLMHPGFAATSEEGRLFVQEIRAVATIDHRHVVRVYQADATPEGRLFYAMELLDGADLQQLIGDGRVAPARAVALTRQLLAALDAAHGAALVHADVKPGNVIVVTEADGERLVLVDFGLARLAAPGAAPSAGGTPAFMAPEQLRFNVVDARSDQFSAALVLVMMLTGWRRRRAVEAAPPDEALAQIAERSIRDALVRALALDPARRFPSVAAFSAALAARPARPPFRGLAALTEDDAPELHGRERELAHLTELACHRRMLIITAPSGAGKTSLLRAGLLPGLARLGIATHFASCRADDARALATAITPAQPGEAPTLRQVIVLDQIEDALQDHAAASWLELAAATVRGVAGANVVLSVREDFLARLLEQLPERGDGVAISRVGPLDADGARRAIEQPLLARQLALEPGLLARLLVDLVAAGEQLGAELGWTVPRPVFPPHLQLVCAALYDRRAPDATTLTLVDYEALGGFDAIVGEHLDHVLDGLAASDAEAAREVFILLVTSARLRRARTEDELAAAVSPVHRPRLVALLEQLRRQGLLVRSQRAGDDLVWELIHDSLVPRIQSWLDRRDLARRRVMELVRHHLRRTTELAPSLLSRAELRELDAHPEVVEVLDREWRPMQGAERAWRPSALVRRSRITHRRSRLAACALGLAVMVGVGAAIRERRSASAARQAEAARRDLDLGLVTFELAPFDWDAASAQPVPVPVAALPELAWQVHAPSFDDPDEPGPPLHPERLRRLRREDASDGRSRSETVEAPGGAAFLVITGRGRRGTTCARSLVPLRGLPGYARRSAGPQHIRIAVPVCEVSTAATIEIPAGPVLFGGVGTPASDYQAQFPERATERTLTLPAFRIDRTEVTNAAFAVFAAMRDATGIAAPSKISTDGLEQASDANSPVSSRTWREARAYCRYLGKELPSSAEWEKALRGGTTLDAADNPAPRRNYPWGHASTRHQANLNDEVPRGIRAVGTFATDVSPYGVLDLAGNLTEWIRTPPTDETEQGDFFRDGGRMTRGGNWSETPSDDLANYMAIENARPGDTRSFTIGWRCVVYAAPAAGAPAPAGHARRRARPRRS